MSSDAITSFAQLALAAPVLKVIDEIGYETPSPIQAQSIPPLLEGRDLLGQAQTGTGKTAAFALPLLSRLDLGLKQPQILVLAPTRELAIQVAEAMQTYARHLPGFYVVPIYGGQSMDIQLKHLRRGVHAVVGTPGRVLDHLRRRSLKLERLSALVLDEADEMLRMGFIDDVEEILGHTPAEKQVALFSATMPSVIRKVAQRHLKDPLEIAIKTKTTTVDTVTQRYWQVSGLHKLDALTRILEVEDFEAMIVFVRTKTATVELAEKLEARGYTSAALNGDMNQTLREKTIDRLKKGTLEIVVATDVAARGLDVERISHVVNYDIPYDTEAYVHRIGRTGRAGRKGEAILFVSPRERNMLRAIEKATRQTITPMQLPSIEAVTGRRVMQFKQTVSDAIESQDLAFFEDLIADYQKEHNVGLSEIAAAMAYLLQRERPLQVPPRKAGTPAPPADDAAAGHRPRKPAVPRSREKPPGEDMRRYRIEVGRADGVQPKNIVGAIANEADLDSRYIGPITLYDSFSTVDLPDGMPRELFMHLKQVRVCGKPMRIRFADEKEGGPGAVQEPGRSKGGPKRAAAKGAKHKDRKKKDTRRKASKREDRQGKTRKGTRPATHGESH